VKLIIDPSCEPVEGALLYRVDEYSFATEPEPPSQGSCLTLNNTVQLIVDRTRNQVLNVEGYCPIARWRRARLIPPPHSVAGLRVEGAEFLPGAGVAIAQGEAMWPGHIDWKTGWVLLETPDERSPDHEEAVEFAPGSIAVLNEGKLVALWLHPEKLPG
jgi:hypothetical protein